MMLGERTHKLIHDKIHDEGKLLPKLIMVKHQVGSWRLSNITHSGITKNIYAKHTQNFFRQLKLSMTIAVFSGAPVDWKIRWRDNQHHC